MPRKRASKLLLSDACQRLIHDYQVPTDYQRVYRGVCSGRVPAERDARGSRWLIDPADLPAIAETMRGVGRAA